MYKQIDAVVGQDCTRRWVGGADDRFLSSVGEGQRPANFHEKRGFDWQGHAAKAASAGGSLPLQDALALAIENNLDIELQRYAIPAAGYDLLRAKGGGVTRGLNYVLAEVPVGVGGGVSALVTNPAASGRATAGSSVATNALE